MRTATLTELIETSGRAHETRKPPHFVPYHMAYNQNNPNRVELARNLNARARKIVKVCRFI